MRAIPTMKKHDVVQFLQYIDKEFRAKFPKMVGKTYFLTVEYNNYGGACVPKTLMNNATTYEHATVTVKYDSIDLFCDEIGENFATNYPETQIMNVELMFYSDLKGVVLSGASLTSIEISARKYPNIDIAAIGRKYIFVYYISSLTQGN